MKHLRVGINGCGRLGRAVLRQYLGMIDPRFQIVVVQDLMPLEQLYYLLRFDSVHGRLSPDEGLTLDQSALGFNTPHGAVKYVQGESSDWQPYELDLLVDVSGAYVQAEQSLRHLEVGARSVLLAAPLLDSSGQIYRTLPEFASPLAPGAAFDFSGTARIFTAYSCTTQALYTLLAPLLARPEDIAAGRFRTQTFTDSKRSKIIESVMVTELHGFTAGQALIDKALPDWRRGRAASESIIPTPTQGIFGVETFFPMLQSRIAGFSIRVPVPNLAAVDICLHMSRPVRIEEILDLYRAAASGPLAAALAVDDELLVSIDYTGRQESAILASDLCQVNGHQLRLYAWYDNEYGYASRVLESLQKGFISEVSS